MVWSFVRADVGNESVESGSSDDSGIERDSAELLFEADGVGGGGECAPGDNESGECCNAHEATVQLAWFSWPRGHACRGQTSDVKWGFGTIFMGFWGHFYGDFGVILWGFWASFMGIFNHFYGDLEMEQ